MSGYNPCENCVIRNLLSVSSQETAGIVVGLVRTGLYANTELRVGMAIGGVILDEEQVEAAVGCLEAQSTYECKYFEVE